MLGLLVLAEIVFAEITVLEELSFVQVVKVDSRFVTQHLELLVPGLKILVREVHHGQLVVVRNPLSLR